MHFEPIDASNERRLARSRRTANNDALALLDDEVDIVQDMEGAIPLVDARQHNCRTIPRLQF